jgi:hypothetical protein
MYKPSQLKNKFQNVIILPDIVNIIIDYTLWNFDDLYKFLESAIDKNKTPIFYWWLHTKCQQGPNKTYVHWCDKDREFTLIYYYQEIYNDANNRFYFSCLMEQKYLHFKISKDMKEYLSMPIATRDNKFKAIKKEADLKSCFGYDMNKEIIGLEGSLYIAQQNKHKYYINHIAEMDNQILRSYGYNIL